MRLAEICVVIIFSACTAFGNAGSVPAASVDGGEGAGKVDGAVSMSPCGAPALLCLDFETQPQPRPPWTLDGSDQGKYFKLGSGPFGSAGHWVVPDQVNAKRDLFVAKTNPTIDPAMGFTLDLDLALVSMPAAAQDVTFVSVLGQNNGYSLQLVFSHGALQVAEWQLPDNFQEHPSSYALVPGKWVHVTLRAFGETATSSLSVEGKTVESNRLLLEVPKNGTGSLQAMWVGLINEGGTDGPPPLDFYVDNLRLTSP